MTRSPAPSRATARAAIVALGIVALAAGGARLGAGPDRHRAPAAAPSPRFEDISATAGVDHRYEGGFRYFVGGGVAVFDCDDDGRPELYLAGGESPAGLFHNDSPFGGPIRFRPMPDAVTDLTDVVGAYPLDIDGDRRTDLVVLRHGPDVVLRGIGGCRFEPASRSFGIVGGPGWTVAFSATWETPESTLPTLAFGDYVIVDELGRATPDCADGLLLRPDGAGLRYAAPIALSPAWCPLSMLFSDWARAGRRDLRATNDRHYYRDGEEQLWRVEPGSPPRLYTRADGWQRLQINGMGIATVDLTGDGLPEVYLTSQGDNKLQTLTGDPTRPMYQDMALRVGATAHRPFAGGDILPSTAWHPEFADPNADGFVDLFVSKGNVEAQPDHASRDPSNLLIGQADGTFVEGAEAAGILDYGRARGAALVDLDLDGWLDLVVVVREAPVRIYRNRGLDGHGGLEDGGPPRWVAVALDQGGSNHDAVGSWIAIRLDGRILEREVTIGGGHAGGRLGPAYFGLGAARTIEIRVTWPDGAVGPWLPLDGPGSFLIERGATEPRPLPWGTTR